MAFDLIILEYLILGSTVGIIYGLMALGLTLLFGVAKIVNFAHGEFYMLGGYFFFYFATIFGIDTLVSIVLAVALTGLVGLAVERLLLKPMYSLDPARLSENIMMATFGISIAFQNLAIFLFGPLTKKPPDVINFDVHILGLTITGGMLAGFFAAILTTGLLYVFLSQTWIGRAIRSVSQSKEGAQAVGVETTNIYALTFAISCALAAMSGVLLGPVFLVYPTSGTSPAIKSFVIIVLGGMGSTKGAIIGGLLLGIAESLGAAYISANYKDAFGFVLLILMLVFRPNGLFGELGRRD